MTSNHFTIMVSIKEVTHTDGPSVYDNVKRCNVPTKGDRIVEDIVSITARADDLAGAIRKAASHLYAEDPTIVIIDDETQEPIVLKPQSPVAR